MSFPAGWTVLSGMADTDEADTARYHALGNAVTPPVAEWIAARVHGYLAKADPAEQGVDDMAAALA
jgi:DNA (cytosine-5)-methyltransferase 1